MGGCCAKNALANAALAAAAVAAPGGKPGGTPGTPVLTLAGPGTGLFPAAGPAFVPPAAEGAGALLPTVAATLVPAVPVVFAAAAKVAIPAAAGAGIGALGAEGPGAGEDMMESKNGVNEVKVKRIFIRCLRFLLLLILSLFILLSL